MTGDPFSSARRALFYIGPLMIGVGGALAYVGATGSGLSWLLAVFGGVVVLLGLIRMVTGAVVLGFERRRVRVLRTGTPATAQITSLRELRKQAGYPIYEFELTLTKSDGTVAMKKRRGAVPVQYAGSLKPGDELPIRLGDDGSTYAIDWDQL